MDQQEFCAVQDLLGLSTPALADAIGKSRSVVSRYRNGDYAIPEIAGKAIWLLYAANYGLNRVIISIMTICHDGKMVGTGVIAEKLYWIGYRFPRSSIPGSALHQLAQKGEVTHVRHGVYSIPAGAKHRNRRGTRSTAE